MTATTSGATARQPTSVAPEDRGWGWQFARVSGLVLFVLLPIQVVATLVTTDVGATTVETVARRWDNPTWRALDWAVLVLGLVHGTYGLHRLVESARLTPATRGLLLACLYTGVAVLLALGTFAAFTFDLT